MIDVPVSRSAVFDCITDYPAAARIFSNVAASQVDQVVRTLATHLKLPLETDEAAHTAYCMS